MTREHLLETAQGLQQPPAGVAEEFDAQQDALAAELNARMSKRPDLARLLGEGNQLMMEDNSRNFTRFMGSMFRAYEPEVLVETCLWVFRAYRSHGFQLTYWPANIDTCVEVLRDGLSEEAFAALYPFYEWLIVSIPAFAKISDEQLSGGDLGEAPSHG